MIDCDLCSAAEVRALPQPPRPRALRSDRQLVDGILAKAECSHCGLVRDVTPVSLTPRYYRNDYRVDQGDHVFHGAGGDKRRSTVFADWITRALEAAAGPEVPGCVLEIGAGRGFLLAELASRWSGARCQGLELGVDAAAAARARGLDVIPGDTTQLDSSQFDVIVAVAVLEHVPSPTAFLAEVRRLLAPDGFAVLIQPTQDVPSYDVFFVDHLHHFATGHLRGYAAKCGFAERHVQVGFEFMPNFSAHAWQALENVGSWSWSGAAVQTSCAATLQRVLKDMGRLDESAAAFRRAGRAFGVFGLHEVFALTRAYSSVDEMGICCGLDDVPAKPEYRQFAFPVMRPEDCASTGVRDVFLTMNRMYYPYASERLATLGLVAHPVLS